VQPRGIGAAQVHPTGRLVDPLYAPLVALGHAAVRLAAAAILAFDPAGRLLTDYRCLLWPIVGLMEIESVA
jgi:hypothetical protein